MQGSVTYPKEIHLQSADTILTLVTRRRHRSSVLDGRLNIYFMIYLFPLYQNYIMHALFFC